MLLQVSKSDNPLPLADVSPMRFSNLESRHLFVHTEWKKCFTNTFSGTLTWNLGPFYKTCLVTLLFSWLDL